MLSEIIWNRTVNMYKNGFGINNLQWLICHKTKPNLLDCIFNYDVFLQFIQCTFKECFSEYGQKNMHTDIFAHLCSSASENQLNIQTIFSVSSDHMTS